MNSRLDEFKRKIRNRKVAVLGIGVSNTPLIKFLCSLGVDVTAFDRSNKVKLESVPDILNGLDVKYNLGQDYLKSLNGFDMVFRTPGIRYDIPELLKAAAEGTEVTSEMEVFFDLCPAGIFAVTGSDGKTTTTTLIYKILKEQGYKCWLGGNIGMPLLGEIDRILENDMVILELSSFQLQTMKTSPQVAVVTNISPNHLDVHKSMEEYVEAKKNIFKYQTGEDRVVLNYDNLITRGFASQAKGRIIYFSTKNDVETGAVLKDGILTYKRDGSAIGIVKIEKIAIPGLHNVENYLAAIAAVIDYVQPEAIYRVAASFKGVEHRIELIRELNGVRFYNDSIATSPSRAIAGLDSFKQKVILIAGGKDKNIPYDILGRYIADKVKCLALLGQTASKIETALNNEIKNSGRGKDIPVFKCTTLEEAVKKAYSCAAEGDIILLSPASSSLDMFKNFEERGNRFKEIVMSLE